MEHRELLLKKEGFDYVCDLTREMDMCLNIERHSFNTYIYHEKIDGYWLIRYPGATRGKIVVDENDVIKNIILYDNTYVARIYGYKVKNIFKKYIGKKIIIEE